MCLGSSPRAATLVGLTLAALACGDPSSPTGPGPIPDRPNLITNGTPTGGAYGNVGALVVDFDGDGTVEGFEQLCSGSLIAPTVFLTAGHCFFGFPETLQFYVTFDPSLLPIPSGLIPVVTTVIHPEFPLPGSDGHDLAVAILPAGSTTGIQPLQLPPEGYLDDLAAQGGLVGQDFVNVGYGVSALKPGRPRFTYDGLRKASVSPFMALRPAWLGLLMNTAATGAGGDCYGDSGSPKFIEGNDDLIVAVTSWGDRPCRATSWDYRLDTESARAFLDDFVALP